MGALQGKRLGLRGILPASALGILSPLCMYGTVPIVASFARAGMREDWIAAFMMSPILLNPQLFFYSFALGTELALLRLLLCFLGGCVAGALVRPCFQDRHFYTFTAFDLPESHGTDPNLLLRVVKNLVALDRACIDLVYAARNSASLQNRIESRNGLHTLENAEAIGLGSRSYRLVQVTN